LVRIAVFGTGGVGGYFGGRLAQAGEEVVFIARGQHLAAIREHGLQVSSVAGDFIIQPAAATDTPASVDPVDLVLVGVKAWQVNAAAEAMRPLLRRGTMVLPLQNGIEAPQQLAEIVGEGHVLGGLCRVIALVSAPGHIRHPGVEPYIAFGELDDRPSERTEHLREAFTRAQGLRAEIPANIQVAMWSKFLFIASLSGMGAVTRLPLGEIRSHPETREMLIEAMEEIHRVALRRGIPLPEDIVTTTLSFIDGLPPDGTTSMQRDIIDARPSELDAQSGAVVRLGRQLGVEVPVHRFIYRALLPLERGARRAAGID
jgi:2-dehydropantoate 2-reductase